MIFKNNLKQENLIFKNKDKLWCKKKLIFKNKLFINEKLVLDKLLKV